MPVKISVIKEETRKNLEENIRRGFPKVECDNDLEYAVQTVLGDRNIFMVLALGLGTGKGLMLGNYTYFDDATSYVHYGLTLDWQSLDLPRRTKIFTFETTGRLWAWEKPSKQGLHDSLPRIKEGELPTAEKFIYQVNEVLQHSGKYLIKLP
ncbi:hypothetical protein HYW76_00615 [Candidatus Pacearchaeota archaeon]|nr:hypothetical protein [Candidatus Pacearchaeota archaeon]